MTKTIQRPQTKDENAVTTWVRTSGHGTLAVVVAIIFWVMWTRKELRPD